MSWGCWNEGRRGGSWLLTMVVVSMIVCWENERIDGDRWGWQLKIRKKFATGSLREFSWLFCSLLVDGGHDNQQKDVLFFLEKSPPLLQLIMCLAHWFKIFIPLCDPKLILQRSLQTTNGHLHHATSFVVSIVSDWEGWAAMVWVLWSCGSLGPTC